jgi:hypothetical protein
MNSALRLAEAIRAACLDAASRAYEDAGIRGLCHEGRWEIALQAIKTLDLNTVLSGTPVADGTSTDGGSP